MCDEEYIGGDIQDLWERYKEHLKEPSPIYGHSNQTGHSTNPGNFTITGSEDHSLARTIKESIHIRVNNPALNRSVGRYNLHHIWDRVLFHTPDLYVSNDNRHVHRTSFSWHAQPIATNRHAHRTTEQTYHMKHIKIYIDKSKNWVVLPIPMVIC